MKNKAIKIICPHCKKEIDALLFSNSIYGRCWLDGNELYYKDKGGNEEPFECPECYHPVAHSEEDAITFLKTGKIAE